MSKFLTRCREVAKRLECVQLAGAFEWPGAYESGSKLHALQTLRATSCGPGFADGAFVNGRRLNYGHRNALEHGLVPVANQYPWCSAAWFERTASPVQVRTIYRFKVEQLKVEDDF